MAVTEQDVKQQIILEVGDVHPQTGDPPALPEDGIIATRIDYLWDRYAAWDQVGPGLRELHCRAAAIRLVLGVLSPRRFDHADSRAGLSVRAHQLVESYQAMLETTLAAIEAGKADAGIGGSLSPTGPYQSGRLVNRVPVPAPGPPDPNARKYGGTVRGL
jgi:hypothetical protein